MAAVAGKRREWSQTSCDVSSQRPVLSSVDDDDSALSHNSLLGEFHSIHSCFHRLFHVSDYTDIIAY